MVCHIIFHFLLIFTKIKFELNFQKVDQQISKELQFPKQSLSYFMWEQHNVTLFKNPNYGYGIAISGGSDSNNKDSSIYISDVVQGGPAENKLK